MLLSILRLRPIVKLPNGQSFWAEKSQLKLPSGGKKMEFGLKFVGVFFVVVCGFTYVALQADLNPDSKYGRLYDYIVKEGIGALFKQDPEKQLSPDRLRSPTG